MQKKLIYNLITILVLVCSCSPVFSQSQNPSKAKGEVRIGGSVTDSFTNIGLPAFVTLLGADSAVVDTATCHVYQGFSSFRLYIPKVSGTYTLRAEYDGYHTAEVKENFDFSKPQRGYGFPDVKLKRKANAEDSLRSVGLGEVVVRGTRLQVAYRGDTLVYNAEAFNIPEGAMLDALVRQLPGAELKANGDVYINGKRLDYITLNGNDFFKGKNKVILENLPYFTVKELQVYHKDPPMALVKPQTDEEKDYVLDVIMKREYAVGTIMNAEAGMGTDSRWKAKAFALRYDEYSRLSLFANLNNTNENRTPGTDGDWSPSKQMRGQLTTKQAGMNMNVNNAKRTFLLDHSALFEWSDRDIAQRQRSETFASDGSVWGGKNATNHDKDFTFTDDLSVQMMLKGATLSLNNHITYKNGETEALSSDSTYRESLINTDRNQTFNDTRTLNINGTIGWRRMFKTPYSLGLNANYSYNNRSRDNSHVLRNTHYLYIGRADTRNDYRTNLGDRYSYTLAAEHGYRLSPRVSMGYTLSYRQSGNGRDYEYYRLYDRYGESYGGVRLPSTADSLQAAADLDNSYEYYVLSRGVDNRLRIGYSWKNTSITAMLTYQYMHDRMRYAQNGLDTVARRSYGNWQPYLSIGRKWNKNRNSLNILYRANTSQPDFQRLMPYRDSGNALYVRYNNPGLRSQRTNTVSAELRMNPGGMKPAWWLKYDLEAVSDAWGNRVSYNTSTGGYTSMADNVDGNWNTAVTFGMNGLIDQSKRWRYDVTAGVKYTHSVDFNTAIDTESSDLSRVNTVNPNATCKVTYRRGVLSFGGTVKYSGQFTHEEEYGRRDMNVHEYSVGGNAQYTVPVLKLTIGTDLTLYSQKGYDADFMNTDDVVWNAFLSRPLFKGRVVAKAEMYDILHQLSNRYYKVNAQSRMETYYNSVPHYAMFSLSYKLTKKPKK